MASLLRPSFVAPLLCVIGATYALPMGAIQLMAETMPSSSTATQSSGPPGPPDMSVVTHALESVNESLDKVDAVIQSVNSTAYDNLGNVLGALASMQLTLATLSNAAAAASALPGATDIAYQADSLINIANSSLQKAQEKLPQALDSVSTQLGEIMPELYAITGQLSSQLLDALTSIRENLYNVTESETSLAEKPQGGKHASKHAAHHAGVKKSLIEVGSDSRSHASSHERANHEDSRALRAKQGVAKRQSMLLLQERVFQELGTVESSSVEQSVERKGSKNPCGKATAMIAKANDTAASLSTAVGEVNATVSSLAADLTAKAEAAIDFINGTVSPALDGLPSNLVHPVQTGLRGLLTLKASLTSDLQRQQSEYGDNIQAALTGLASVVELTVTLQAAVTEACLQGACGAEAQQKCEAQGQGGQSM